MALTLIKETGAIVAGANTYATRAEAIAYFEGRLYAEAFTGAEAADQDKALVHACRLLDASASPKGDAKAWDQPRAWPRINVPGLPETVVPPGWVQAQIELARWVLIEDREAKADKPALKRQKLEGIEREFANGSGITLLPEIVQRLVAPWVISTADAGNASGGAASSGAYRVTRG